MSKKLSKRSILERALERTREEVSDFREKFRKQKNQVKNLEEEIDRLKKENEQLKEELKLAHQKAIAHWAKPNKKSKKKAKVRRSIISSASPKSKRCVKPKHIDEEWELIPCYCSECTHRLPPPHKWHTHIQTDLPELTPAIVRKYYVGWSYCKSCKKEVSARDKLSKSAYGPQLHARVVSWKFGLGLTLGKIQKMLLDQYKLDLKTSVLSDILQRSGRMYEPQHEQIRQALHSEGAIYADETGWRMDGYNRWLWSFSSEKISFYKIDPSRGQKVIGEVMGPVYHGILSSDFYNCYNAIKGQKQKCWVHLFRYLRESEEIDPKNREIKNYNRRIHHFYKRGLQLREAFKNNEDIEKRYKRLLMDTQKWLFKESQHKRLKNISRRLKNHFDSLFTFIKNDVDPNNNAAEREIRPAVLMRKTSYGNRSEQGAKTQAILMSILRTTHKQGQSFLRTAPQFISLN